MLIFAISPEVLWRQMWLRFIPMEFAMGINVLNIDWKSQRCIDNVNINLFSLIPMIDSSESFLGNLISVIQRYDDRIVNSSELLTLKGCDRRKELASSHNVLGCWWLNTPFTWCAHMCESCHNALGKHASITLMQVSVSVCGCLCSCWIHKLCVFLCNRRVCHHVLPKNSKAEALPLYAPVFSLVGRVNFE